MQMTSEAQRRALKTAFRVLVAKCGGLEAAAAATRVSKTCLASGYDAQALDRFPAVDVIADLEAAAGEPLVTKMLGSMHGFALVHVAPQPGSEMRAIAAVSTCAAEMLAEFSKASAPGALTPSERAGLYQKMLALVAVASDAAAKLSHTEAT